MNTLVVLLAMATMALAQHNQWNHAPNQWNNWGNDNQPKWHGPIALPPGFDKNGAPLPVQDTPEVAAEKSAQLSVLARAGGNVPAPNWNGGPQGGWNGGQGGWAGGPQGGWNGGHGGWNGGPQGGWGGAPHGHGRWRRSLLVGPLGLGHLGLGHLGLGHYTQFPGSTGPLLHAPLVGGWGLHTPYAHWG